MKYALTFFVFLLTFDLFGKTYEVDSIRIVGLQHSVYDGFARNELFDFVEKVKHVPFDCDPSDTLSMFINSYMCEYVDTIVYDKIEVQNLLVNIKKLKVNEKLPYGSSQCPTEARYSIGADLLYWVPVHPTLYYLVLIVFSTDCYEFIWVGADIIERGYKQYKLSSEYKSILSKYSEVYKE